MRRLVIVVVLALAAVGLGMSPAPGLPGPQWPGVPSPGAQSDGKARSVLLYMVKDVEDWDAPTGEKWSGGYYVLRKTGTRVVGQRGFLHYDTDDMCVTGTVTGRKAHLVGRRGGEEPYHFYETWLGTGATQHVKGYQSVTRIQLRDYLMGTDPQKLIDRCTRG